MARFGYGSFWGYQEREIADPVTIRKQLGRDPLPVSAPPRKRKTAESFWGQAWCDHLETYGGMANRLPRGRTYLRQGAVRDLYIERGQVTALVQGMRLYEVVISIDPLEEERVVALAKRLGGRLSSALELLGGKLDESVTRMVTEPAAGLFPERSEIGFSCSCPDGARICKHIAAVFYGIGSRLDSRPELFFELRGTSAERMVAGVGHLATDVDSERELDGDLSAIFGIELSADPPAPVHPSGREAAKPRENAPPARRRSPKKAKAPKASWSRRKVATRAELLAAGLASSTVQRWLQAGYLEPTDQRGRYRLQREARRRLVEREK